MPFFCIKTEKGFTYIRVNLSIDISIYIYIYTYI